MGQLGNSTFTSSLVPVVVDGLTSVVALASAHDASHVCALTSIGGMKCWGYGSLGQLGNGTTVNTNAPVDVTGLTSGVSAIATGAAHTCAVTATGGVKCWGWNNWGQLGNGEGGGGGDFASSVPVDVVGLSAGVRSVANGGYFTCAMTTAGGVKCWGLNFQGELGNNSPPNAESNVPVDVTGLSSGVVAIASGWVHTCVITASGGMKCWGDGEWGQLGNGSNPIGVGVPIDVQGLDGRATSLSAGERHTCARLAGSVAKCWGWNEFGQLGNDSTADSNLPVEVASG
jgi:alpha-tubulin suppressor-like RCC1 family protein